MVTRNTTESNSNRSAQLATLWKDPKFRAKMTKVGKAQAKKLWAAKGFKAKLSRTMKAHWRDEEWRKRVQKAMKRSSQ